MNANRLRFSAWLGPPGPSALVVVALSALMLTACAESDPYKRLELRPTVEVTTYELVKAYNNRWPEQFKCVQTVTIDFGPVTKTFNALLIVQRSGKFRIQGMTEQGIKIFELAHNEEGDHVLFKADEMNEGTITGISKDIQRVFLEPLPGVAESRRDAEHYYLEANTPSQVVRVIIVGEMDDGALAATPRRNEGDQAAGLWVDRVESDSTEGRLYCLGNYDWKLKWHKTGAVTVGWFVPSVIVLRDSGRDSKSYPYKLTIKINELTVRDTPWPEKTFKP